MLARTAVSCALIFVPFLLLPSCAPSNPARSDREAPALSPDARLGAPRAPDTIFSPLPLPPPTDTRLPSGAPGPAYWQQRADYVIDATLDPATRELSATARLTYTNNSPHELRHLWLHLEQNLYRLDSTGARMTKPGARFGNLDFDGGLRGLTISIADGPHAGRPLAFDPAGVTTRLDLPDPLPAGGATITLALAWRFTIPPYGSDRMGIKETPDGDIFQLAQWFPAVAVCDDVHGWNTLPYLGQGEFYTNFGRFQVAITVPRTHIVAATGALTNPRDVLTATQLERLASVQSSREVRRIIEPAEVGTFASRPPRDPAAADVSPDTLTWRFVADDVRTFAFASSPAFIWDAAWSAGLGPGAALEPGSTASQGVLCQSFYPKAVQTHWSKSTDMVRQSIEHYSKKWLTYPYPTAQNVHGRCAGMEYPMLAFCAGDGDEFDLWGVTTHEVGHNWFPMIVNSDERRHAWMDEGFCSFINHLAWAERYPDRADDFPIRKWARDNPRPAFQPIDTPADQLFEGTLGRLQYGKTALGLRVLRSAVLGPDRFDRAFREYARRWAFRSPRPADFFRTIEDAAGEDLSWFWRGWFYETGVLDQAVGAVIQPEAAGSSDDAASRNARVTIRNLGELVFPVTFKVTYTDGSDELRSLPVQVWATTNAWQTTWDTRGRLIRSIELDPEGLLPDVNAANDAWPR